MDISTKQMSEGDRLTLCCLSGYRSYTEGVRARRGPEMFGCLRIAPIRAAGAFSAGAQRRWSESSATSPAGRGIKAVNDGHC